MSDEKRPNAGLQFAPSETERRSASVLQTTHNVLKEVKPMTMTVEQLIARLGECEPTAQILVEGAAETFWAVRDLSDDESGTACILFVGGEVAVKTDD